MIQDNMDSLLSNQMNLMKVSMDLETRKRESAIIRELQKKMAAYSTEKVWLLLLSYGPTLLALTRDTINS